VLVLALCEGTIVTSRLRPLLFLAYSPVGDSGCWAEMAPRCSRGTPMSAGPVCISHDTTTVNTIEMVLSIVRQCVSAGASSPFPLNPTAHGVKVDGIQPSRSSPATNVTASPDERDPRVCGNGSPPYDENLFTYRNWRQL
jgi:hypothetical protein